MNLNRIIIAGRATAAPELRSTQGGESVVTLGVATNRAWTDKGGQKQEETEFHNVVIFGKQALIADQYVRKGTTVLIEGRLKTRVWTDKAGARRSTTEIIAEHLELGPKPQMPEKVEQAEGLGHVRSEDKDVIYIADSQEIKPEDIPF